MFGLINGGHTDAPVQYSSRSHQKNTERWTPLHCGKDGRSLHVQKVQAKTWDQNNMRIKFGPPALEGEGKQRDERPPKPTNHCSNKEKEQTIPVPCVLEKRHTHHPPPLHRRIYTCLWRDTPAAIFSLQHQ